MSENTERWFDVKLLQLGTSPYSGNIYPEETIAKAINELKARQYGSPLHGECNTPQIRDIETTEERNQRLTSISEENVSHLVDTSSLRIENGAVMGKLKASGPMKSVVAERLEENKATFGMRALVRYKEGSTTQTENLTVEHCNIICFDLINEQL